MRRAFFMIGLVAALMAISVPAFAAHCTNNSKADGAGEGVVITIDETNERIYVDGHGGFATIMVDLDGDGVGDFVAESGIMLGKNHAYVENGEFPFDLDAWVNPGAINKFLKENPTVFTNGIGFHE